MHTCQQLGKGERFDHVVVAAFLQSGNSIGDTSLGTEDDHRGLFAIGTHALNDGEAVKTRQHQVDDGGIVVVDQRKIEAL